MEISTTGAKPIIIEVEGCRVKLYPESWLVPEPLKLLKGVPNAPPSKKKTVFELWKN